MRLRKKEQDRVLEGLRKAAGRIGGWSRPQASGHATVARPRKANAFRFRDDGFIPNHPKWPLIVYRGAVRLQQARDPAGVFEDLFARNGWSDSWRNGIYGYAHYHSRIHEVLGVARGHVQVRFGGKRGRTITMKAGDVAILPAGTGHQRIAAGRDLLVVGAYPHSGTYDECSTAEDHKQAVKTIPKVARPHKDPVYGAEGALITLWSGGTARRGESGRRHPD